MGSPNAMPTPQCSSVSKEPENAINSTSTASSTPVAVGRAMSNRDALETLKFSQGETTIVHFIYPVTIRDESIRNTEFCELSEIDDDGVVIKTASGRAWVPISNVRCLEVRS